MKALNKQCKGVKPDGSQCHAAALRESDFCFFHDPSKAGERRAAHAAGGRQNRIRTLDDALPDVKIKDCSDVIVLLSETINQVRKGVIDPRVANSVGYLANQMVRVLAQDELAGRIERLEQLVARRSDVPELLITGTTNVKTASSQKA